EVRARGSGMQVAGNADVYDHKECAFTASHGIYLHATQAGSAASHNIIRHNVIHDNGSRGLLIGSGDNNAAYNNLIYRTAVGYQKVAINMNASSHVATNAQLYSNTTYGN